MYYQSLCKKLISFSDVWRYILGETGGKDCEEQGMLNIMDHDECKAACNELEIPIRNLEDTRICYRSTEGTCRQQTKFGPKWSRICKKEVTYK